MARITPATPGNFVELEDFEPYRFTFKKWEWGTSLPQYGSKRQIHVVLAVNGNPDDTIFDYIPCSINRNRQSGGPSKLTEFLNAFAGKVPATEIAWFDDESGEWGYEDDKVYGRLDDLLEHDLIGRGKNKPKEDGSGSRYRVEHYQSVKSQERNGGPSRPRKAAPATADVDPDAVPF